jgi:iron complex outermembrane receptor protein
VKAAVLAEHRLERQSHGINDYQTAEEPDLPDQQRRVLALVAETRVPLVAESHARTGLRSLELSLATRFEHYDDFGDDTNWRAGLAWEPFRGVRVRGSWSTAFRAPQLSELFRIPGAPFETFVFDDRAGGEPVEVPVTGFLSGNPNLDAETSETTSAGIEVRPHFLPGLSASLTYYRTAFRDRIREVDEGIGQENLLLFREHLPAGVLEFADPAGDPNDPDNALVAIHLMPVNIARRTVSGLDAVLEYARDLGPWSLSGRLDVNRQFELSDRLSPRAAPLELDGRAGYTPHWRGRMRLTAARGDWDAQLYWNWSTGVRLPPGVEAAFTAAELSVPRIRGMSTVDVQLSYRPARAQGWFGGVEWRLGASNLFDTDLPFVPYPPGFDVASGDVRGRVLYMDVRMTF